MTHPELRIARRFQGPPDSGNGGYVAGMLAKALGGSGVEVTLKAPPPLERDLQVEAGAEGARLLDGDAEIAVARRARVELEVPPPPSLDAARAAAARFAGFAQHNFPACFVCGPNRDPGDGLRIFPGAVGAPSPQVAALWTPDPSLSDEAVVAAEFVWAALDCAGYFAIRELAGVAVLGRIAAVLVAPPTVGQLYIVTGWAVAHDGRKHRVGTALHDRDGALLAKASATWITIG